MNTVTPAGVVDAGTLHAASGLLTLVRNAMDRLADGQVLEVRAADSSVSEDLRAWCRLTGNLLDAELDAGLSTRFLLRKAGRASKAQSPDWGMQLPRQAGEGPSMRDWLTGRAGDVPEDASTYLGFVPRGSIPEPGMPAYPFTLNKRDEAWSPSLGQAYEQATARQWHAMSDVPWDQLQQLPDDLERAVCQTMTFLAENEYSALYIPAKFLPRINAQFAETVLFLATLINDEARHIEAFTKRALANGGGLQYSSALTEWSLHGLFVQEDYFRSTFLLHVLGEGTFLDLLAYIGKHAPDPVTDEIVARARADEARHVAYGIAHVRDVLEREPARVDDLVGAAESRAEALQATSGANPAVMEALAVLAAGGSSPDCMAKGFVAARELFKTMDEHRVQRMLQLGLDQSVAQKISELHTPNFM